MIQQLHRALGFAGEKDDVARRERLRHFLGDLDLDSADVVEPLAMLLGLSADPGSDAGPADPEQVRRAVFAARGLPLQCSGEAQCLWSSRTPTGLIPRPQNMSVRCSLTWRPNGFSFC